MPTSDTKAERLVADLFGDQAVDYLRHKHTGGGNGAKGTRYEDLFAVSLIADCARALNGVCGRMHFESQASMHFVDDLITVDQQSQVQHCHQLKNSSNVVWGTGERCIRTDFERQLELSRANGYASVELVLVVSDQDSAEKLAAKIPAELAATTKVLWFPWEEAPTKLCEIWPDKLRGLAWLSRHANPDFQRVAEVLCVMGAAWVACGCRASASDMIAQARSLSPQLIRPLVSDAEIMACVRGDFQETLAKIDNFSYSIVKGFFTWEFFHPNGGATRGIFPEDCLSDQFRKFQERVVRRAPATPDEIEEELP